MMKTQQELTQDLLKSIVSYDPETGVFTRISSSARRFVGKPAGTSKYCNGTFYWKIKILNRQYSAHRLAWLHMYGHFPADQIDHIDGDGLNNRIENLRCVDQRDNNRNRRIQANNTSGICGVYFEKSLNKWRVRIRVDRHYKHFGLFEDIEEARKVRKEVESQFGFHINHGKERILATAARDKE